MDSKNKIAEQLSQKNQLLHRIKIIAGMLIIGALFLPISQCRGPVEPGSEHQPKIIKRYIFDAEKTDLESVLLVISWILPVLLVIAGIWYSSKILLTVLQLLSITWSAFHLYGLLLFSHKILIGGYVAMVAIMLYFSSALVDLIVKIKNILNRRKRVK